MKRILLIASLSVAAAAFVSTSATAQDTLLQRGGTVARTPSYQSLITAINATPTATEKVKQRTVTAADIRVVDASTVVGGEDDTGIKKALETHKDNLSALRTAIGNNPAYQAALAAHKDKPTAKDVIAVDIMNEGDVLVYFRKM
jgi:hypothetical protein